MVVAHGPLVVLYDENKNPVGVVLDGAVYRLQVEAKVSNFPVVQPVSGPLTNAELRASPILIESAISNAVRSSVAGVEVDTSLLPANPIRKGALIYNDSNSVLHIGLGTDEVTLNDFTFLISAGTLWQLPLGFVGEVRGIWVDSGGAARITELL